MELERLWERKMLYLKGEAQMVRTSEAGQKTCDCGCGGILPDSYAALGRRYLKGHKKVIENKIRTKMPLKVLPPSGVVQTSLPAIENFAQKQRELLDVQITEVTQERDKLNKKLESLLAKSASWHNIENEAYQLGAIDRETVDVSKAVDVALGYKESWSSNSAQ